jgi:hypothetical protein
VPGQLLTFVSTFAWLGASGVIGTEVAVNLDVAVAVAEQLFDWLTRKAPAVSVAEAIRRLRWDMVSRGNLAGLAYTPYCLAHLRVQLDGT